MTVGRSSSISTCRLMPLASIRGLLGSRASRTSVVAATGARTGCMRPDSILERSSRSVIKPFEPGRIFAAHRENLALALGCVRAELFVYQVDPHLQRHERRAQFVRGNADELGLQAVGFAVDLSGKPDGEPEPQDDKRR